jgi:hypothetical protein
MGLVAGQYLHFYVGVKVFNLLGYSSGFALANIPAVINSD